MSSLRKCLTALDGFLFEVPAPVMCSVIRIAYAVLLLVLTTVWMLDATTWFTEAGVLHLDAARKVAIDGTWSLFFWLPTDPRLVYAGLMILFAQGLLLLLGCWSRFQAACIFVWLTSFHNRNLLICDGEDTVFRLFAFFMIFMPLDHAWSLRRRLFGNEKGQGQARDRVGSSDSAWALRLMQIEVTAIYLSTAYCKWQGVTWRDGTALYYVSRMQDVFGRLWLPDGLFENGWMVAACTWGVLGLETLLPLLLWLPATRRWAIVLGIGLHLSIEYSMHLFLFEWIMIVGLLSFIRPSDWTKQENKSTEWTVAASWSP